MCSNVATWKKLLHTHTVFVSDWWVKGCC